MILAELKPKWIVPSQWAEASPPFYIGLSFLCPHCERSPCPTCGYQRGKRLFVLFWPPIDPASAMGRLFTWEKSGTPHERIRGESFETLTLSPSIGFESIGHWHGSIVDGVCEP